MLQTENLSWIAGKAVEEIKFFPSQCKWFSICNDLPVPRVDEQFCTIRNYASVFFLCVYLQVTLNQCLRLCRTYFYIRGFVQTPFLLHNGIQRLHIRLSKTHNSAAILHLFLNCLAKHRILIYN